MSSYRRQLANQELQEVQEDYEDRRASGRVRYDESNFGASLDDLDNPIAEDPQYRRQVFSEMGNALRSQLQQTRGLPADQRVYVEKSKTTDGPSGMADARKLRVQATRAQFSRPAPYEQEDEYYDDDQYYDVPPVQRRPQRPKDRYEDLEPVSFADDMEEDDGDDGYEPLPVRRPQRQTQLRQSVPQPSRRPSNQRAPVRRDVYDPPSRTVRRPAPRQQPAPQPARRTPPQQRQQVDRTPPQQRGVRPSRPEFLGPDGRIARNPCGFPLYTEVGGVEVTVLCQEERRTDRPHWHPNMPHIARINDERMNAANACFIWYYPDEVPGR